MVIFAGDRNRLVAGNVVVAGSTFRDYARRSRTYRPAISVSGVGDRIEHNVNHAVGLDGAERFVAMARDATGCDVWQQDFLHLDLPDAHSCGNA